MNTEAKLVIDSTGIEIPLNCDLFRIGRSLDCNHVIAEKIVSRCHCVVQKVGDRLWNVSDESTNGTIVNGVLIKGMQSEYLKDGDEIVLNNYNERFIFRFSMNSNQVDNNQHNEESLIDQQLSMLADEIEKNSEAQIQHEKQDTKRLKLNDGSAAKVTACNGNSSSTESDWNTSSADLPSNNQLKHKELNKSESQPSTSKKQPNSGETASKIALPSEETVNEDAEKLENELICSICSELFIKAVTLNCSHTYCKYCIEMWRQRQNGCPICRVKIFSINPTLVLDNVIEQVCSTYPEELKTHRKEVLEQRKQMELANPIPQTSRTNNRHQSITVSSASENSSQSTHTDNDSNEDWNDYDVYSNWYTDNDDDDDDWHLSEPDSDPELVNFLEDADNNSEQITEAAERAVERDIREVERSFREVEQDNSRAAERNTRAVERVNSYWTYLGNDYGRRRWRNQGNCFSCNQYGHYARNCPYNN